MRRSIVRVVGIAFLAVALGSLAGCGGEDLEGPLQEIFQALLSGGNEVPPVATGAAGTAMFSLAGDVVDYSIEVSAIVGVFGAHIHSGTADVNGPIVVPLFSSDPPTGMVDGSLVTGSSTAADVADMTLTFEELLAAMRTGATYVNVHTVANPPGEIRGQVQLAQ